LYINKSRLFLPIQRDAGMGVLAGCSTICCPETGQPLYQYRTIFPEASQETAIKATFSAICNSGIFIIPEFAWASQHFAISRGIAGTKK
jgi:hypothetical protein